MTPILSRLLPEQCVLCQAAKARNGLCARCQLLIPRKYGPACPVCAVDMPQDARCNACGELDTPFIATEAACHYRWPLDNLIQHWKYGPDIRLSRSLGYLLHNSARRLPLPDIVVPMPIHSSRERERGFNQSWELIRYLPAPWKKHAQSQLLTRTRQTGMQSHRSADARIRALAGAFSVSRPLQGESVVIVDDVLTTGSSMRHVSAALRRAGAGEIRCLVLARADSPYEDSHASWADFT
ncbi:ComF family protein [Burkholderiaceae bacterium DAT-1]|nr:ComF family protein [Burkholderiaceae bacterium DAT-1]